MPRVYIVEDHKMIREMLRTVLELEPEMDVVGDATDAEQALSELKSIDVDVVLMDIQLPGMSGVEATRLLSETIPGLPVVMLTSFHEENVELAIRAGAKGYILKTSPSSELVRAIQAAHKGQGSIDPSLTDRLFEHVRESVQIPGESMLTDRQHEILRLVADGVRYAHIADRLAVSETTVTREMRMIFDHLGVSDAAHAVSESYKRGILKP